MQQRLMVGLCFIWQPNHEIPIARLAGCARRNGDTAISTCPCRSGTQRERAT